ncbi:phenylalanine--tRNA ligase subunit alpha [Thermogutta sp.]|uniref:phenylalanine--tRNA ligase subunit alpha n=1 Tax=Thermogutta sp. TaxID=1962930 RepID=UPI00321F9E3D
MDDVLQQLKHDLEAAQDSKQLEQVRIKYLGRKGVITTLAKSTDFGRLSPEEKRSFGQRLNTLKSEAERLLAEATARIQALEKDRVRRIAGLDLSLPSIDRRMGSIHPIALVQMELEEIFQGMGFRVLTGYEVELEYYNFDALNIPPDHPARDMQDTFWLDNGMLLRTHTSANQVRALETYGVPLRAIFPGRCFRNEAIDASHENTFYQLEGLLVDRDISVAHLIAVMKTLLSQVFRREVTVRLRPGFFPFVEPGFELDVQCLICGGKGCSTCKQTGWIELIPCGLVHPKVLEFGRVDPQIYSGFAFGMGLTRLAMMKYGIPDIRLFNSGDIRFYEQFPTAF